MYQDIKNRTIYQLIVDTKNKYPKRDAFYYKGKFFKYSFFVKRINSFAKEFKNLNYGKNDVITVLLPNIPEALYLVYAANQIGAIANIIHPLMKFEQLKEILLKVKSKIVFVLDTRYEEFSLLEKEGIRVIPVCPARELGAFKSFIYRKQNSKKLKYMKHENYYKMDKFYDNEGYIDFDDDYLKDSFYLHSSGTMGKSKTVALSSFNLNALCINAYDILGRNHDFSKVTYMLSALPMFHGFGFGIGIHIEYILGGCNMLMPKFSAKETVKMLKMGKLSILIGVPTLFEALLHAKGFEGNKLSNLITAFVGGDFVSNSLINRFNDRMKKGQSTCRLLQGYGLTETVCVCAVNTLEERREGSVGKALRNVDIKVFNDKQEELPPEEEGEICIAGETVMNGYRFEEPNEVLSPFFEHNQQKFLRTGDYGYLDKDGFLFFKQRIKRIVIVNGVNIFPSDVENVVSSLKYVFQCAAIETPDERFGHMIKLFVVLDNQYKGKNFDQDIKREIVNRCSIYAKPKQIVYIDKLPKTLLGKVDTKNLK